MVNEKRYQTAKIILANEKKPFYLGACNRKSTCETNMQTMFLQKEIVFLNDKDIWKVNW